MPIRIYCPCGTDVTHTVSLWDRKTRSVFWMEGHPPLCARCEAKRQRVPAGVARARACVAAAGACRPRLVRRKSAPPHRLPMTMRAVAKTKPS